MTLEEFDDQIPLGLAFAQYARALSKAQGNIDMAEIIAHQDFSHHSVLKIFNDLQLKDADKGAFSRD